MNNPLLSIIIANYNHSNYIDEAIESVISQVYSNWEIIIVDDCSTDNSLEILSGYSNNSKIKIFQNIKNSGVGFTKNRCIEKSSGEICVVLDPDDILEEIALQKVVDAYEENPEASMIVFGLRKVDSNLQSFNDDIFYNKEGSILDNGGAYGWDTFLRGVYNLTGGYSSEFKAAVDQDLYFKMEEVGNVIFIEEYIYLYRQSENGLSLSNQKKLTPVDYRYRAIELACQRRLIKKTSGKVNNGVANFYLHKALSYPNNRFYQNLFRSFLLFLRARNMTAISLVKYILYPNQNNE